MFSLRTRLILVAAALIGLGSIAVLEFTDWHQLEAVTLNDEPVEDWETRLGLKPGESVLKQPLAEVAARLLKDIGTVKVDIDYSMPNTIKITTNRFTPVCTVIDEVSGRQFGLNKQARVVPLAPSFDDWEHPVLTGVKANRLFEHCSDDRVSRIIPQLKRLAEDKIGLYRLIDEIDFSKQGLVTVTASGLPYRLTVNADRFHEQMSGFIQFVEKYQPDRTGADNFDLRFANMIVQQGGDD
jgi:hypothetical protein